MSQISNEELLKQTIEKFKTFLVDDLNIDEQQLNSNEGLYSQIKLLNQYKPLISIIGQDKICDYVSSVIINYFKFKEINFEQKQKLNNYIELVIDLVS